MEGAGDGGERVVLVLDPRAGEDAEEGFEVVRSTVAGSGSIMPDDALMHSWTT